MHPDQKAEKREEGSKAKANILKQTEIRTVHFPGSERRWEQVQHLQQVP